MSKDYVAKIIELANMMPVTESFLMRTSTEREKSTRFMYGEEIKLFFEYLITFCPEFCDKTLKNLTLEDLKLVSSEHVSSYLSFCADQNQKERTIARKRASLSSFFTYLCNNRKIEYNPVLAATKVKIHKSDQVIHLTLEEQMQFIQDIMSGAKLDKRKQTYHNKYAARDTAIIVLLLDTSIRNSELRGLDIKDVDFDECSIFIQRKGGNYQTLYFSDITNKYLLSYLEERKLQLPDTTNDDPLFTTLKGARLSSDALQKLVKKYAISSLPGKGSVITPHKMRSTSAMAFYGETGDLLALQRKLGHKSIQATNIYAKATDEQMKIQRNTIGKMWENM